MTEKQLKLFRYIRDRIEVGKLCPSNIEMMAHMGIHSKSSITGMLRKLEEEGLLKIVQGKSRNIVLSNNRQHICKLAMTGIIDPIGFVARAKYAGVIQ